MTSPLETAYNRLDEAHRAWHNALDGYHRIEDFRAGINSAIQSFRNLTFALQKQKDNLPNFDNWYAKWQIKMVNDQILKALHSARTVIVHREDLKLKSLATARTKGWIDFEKVTFSFDPLNDSHAVAKEFYDLYAKHLPVTQEIKKRLIFEFERKWIYEKLPDYELLEALAYEYDFFYKMLSDAAKEFSLSAKVNFNTGNYCLADFNDDGQLKCMIVTPQERCLTFSFQNGEIIKIRVETISRDEDELRRVRKKYGDFWKSEEVISMLDGIFPDEYPFDEIKSFVQIAISNLKIDGCLVPMSFILTESSKAPIVISHSFKDQEEKLLSIEKVASEILKNNGRYILMVTEIWQYNLNERKQKVPTAHDTKNAKDLFQASCISADKIKIITIPFRKNIFKKVIFSKAESRDFIADEQHHNYIFLPLIKALRETSLRRSIN